MTTTSAKQNKMDARKRRVRAKIRGRADRPRLTVFRSNKYIYTQIIDDEKGETIASSDSRDLKGENKPALVGADIAEKAKKANITKVVFDRSGYRYTGSIQRLADAARAAGLEF